MGKPPVRTQSTYSSLVTGRDVISGSLAGSAPEPVDEVLPAPVKLPLGQRQDVDDVRQPGQRLLRLRQDYFRLS